MGTYELPKREIKFRAWDNIKNDWRWGIGSALEELMLFGIGNEYNNWTVMQYTGLKDKNGKDIYEGDIVTYPNKTLEKIGKYVVKNLLDFGYFILHYNLIKELEVIGNIFENPELLETNKPTTSSLDN